MPRSRYGTKRRDAKRAGFRSGFEQTIALLLTKAGIPFTFENKEEKIKYVPATRSYLPDFVVNGVIIETKGRFTGADRAKHLEIKAQHPEKEIRFVFMYDNTLSKSSNTRYSDWATKHGFRYCVGTISDEWLAEFAGKPQADPGTEGREGSDGVSSPVVPRKRRTSAQARGGQVREKQLAD